MTQSFKSLLGENKRIIPVIALPNSECALPLCDTLSSAGFGMIEITLRTPHGITAIRELRKSRPNLVIGAGTVKNKDQLNEVIAAGAQFAVSPGLDSGLVTMAQQHDIVMVPGVMTPSEIMLAENLGLNTVKLFPASLAGGTDFINAMASVFPAIQFFPTGGISEDSVNEYLELENVVCAGGTWLTPKSLIGKADWTRIHEIALRC